MQASLKQTKFAYGDNKWAAMADLNPPPAVLQSVF